MATGRQIKNVLVVAFFVVSGFIAAGCLAYLRYAETHPLEGMTIVQPPLMECVQIAGFHSDPPVIVCSSDRFGQYAWQADLDGWTTFYMTTGWVDSSGFEFTTLPPGRRVRILFRDGEGNIAESIISIFSDYRECVPENQCIRVRGTV